MSVFYTASVNGDTLSFGQQLIMTNLHVCKTNLKQESSQERQERRRSTWEGEREDRGRGMKRPWSLGSREWLERRGEQEQTK